MVTLTYPGDWECVAPDGASVKRHMVLWRKRFQREWGEPARYIWKLEFQRRGAPHIHLWMAPPQVPGRSGRRFWEWLSQEWAEIVAHPDPEQRERHMLAGTAVDVRNGLRACDPNAWRSTSQNTHHRINWATRSTNILSPTPGASRAMGQAASGASTGFSRATTVVEIPQDAYLMARRIMRRWSRSQAIYGDVTGRFPTKVVPRTAYRAVLRVDITTGKVRHRKVRGRPALCNQGGLAGGYVLVNDGPAFASQLAAALSAVTADQ